MAEYNGKYIAEHSVDWENRIEMLRALGELIGLSEEDLTILAFIFMGDIPQSLKAQKVEILKKVKLSWVEAKYNREKLKQWLAYLEKQLEAFDKYGVVNFETKEIIKMTKNGEFVTVYGMKVPVLIYVSVVNVLKKNPDYVVDILFGVYKALGIILKFLEAITPEEFDRSVKEVLGSEENE